jgi:hypothetical protein
MSIPFRLFTPCVTPAKAGIHDTVGLVIVKQAGLASFLLPQESIRLAVNASFPDGFLLSQE